LGYNVQFVQDWSAQHDEHRIYWKINK